MERAKLPCAERLNRLVSKLTSLNQKALTETNPIWQKFLFNLRRRTEKRVEKLIPGLHLRIDREKAGWWFKQKSVRIEEIREKPLEERIFEVLTHRRFVRLKPRGEAKAFFTDRIQAAITNQTPLRLVLGFGYHKNPNATSNFLPDIAEAIAIQRMVELSAKVKGVYQPGMEVKIITSGRRAEMVNGMLAYQTFLYHKVLAEFVALRGWREIIEVIPIGKLYEERWEEFGEALAEARKEVQEKWNDPGSREFWIKQIENARRNIHRQGLSRDEIKERPKKAAFDYLVFRRAEAKISLLEQKFPMAINASYNLGHKNTLVLWTLGPGNITQPWQGEGKCIKGKIDVVTQERRKFYEES